MPDLLKESAPLEHYCHNLTRLAKQGAFTPLCGQEIVIDRVFQVLQRKNKCVPLVLACDEIRRRAIVAEVIRRMAIGEAPEELSRQQVIALDYEALFNNLSDDTLTREARIKQRYASLEAKLEQARPDSEEEDALLSELFFSPSLEEWIAPSMALERLQSIFIAMHRIAGSFILYIDNFHYLLGGDADHYAIDASNLLKPVLARRQIELIGACTLEQYREYIFYNAAIQRRCQGICLPEVADDL